jgi:hypothetical protein
MDGVAGRIWAAWKSCVPSDQLFAVATHESATNPKTLKNTESENPITGNSQQTADSSWQTAAGRRQLADGRRQTADGRR